jgi:hypothetical protein
MTTALRPPRLAEYLGVDRRSLLLHRVLIGVCVFADLLSRAGDINAHYTDAGVLARPAAMGEFARRHHWSLHFVTGGAVGTRLVFAVHLWLACGLAVSACAEHLGRRTRGTALLGFALPHRCYAVLLWLLTVSLHARNTMVVHAGDKLLRMLLFWAMFAGAQGPAARRGRSHGGGQHHLSMGTAALLFQSAYVYIFTALHKHGSDWRDGTAVYQSLALVSHATPAAALLRSFPALCELLTPCVWYLELLGGAALLVPFPQPHLARIRAALVFGFVGLNVGFGSCLRLGIFGLVACTALVPFVPSEAWEWAEARWSRYVFNLILIFKIFLLSAGRPLPPNNAHSHTHTHSHAYPPQHIQEIVTAPVKPDRHCSRGVSTG